MKVCYIISFDTTDDKLVPVSIEIKTYRTWARLNNSTWLVVTERRASDIRDHLKTALNRYDKLIVIRAGDSAAWINLATSKSDWLKKHIKS